MSPLNDNVSRGSLQDQHISEIMEDVGIIHSDKYLKSLDKSLQTVPIDGPDGGAVFQVWESDRERARKYPKDYIEAHKRQIRTYLW